MKKDAVKMMLFTVFGLLTNRAFAQTVQTDEIQLLDELPADVRMQVHSQVANFLQANPDIAQYVDAIGVDKKGTVYVLDRQKYAIAKVGGHSTLDDNL